VAAELLIWIKFGIATGSYDTNKVQVIFSYKLVVLNTENAEICAMLAVSM
jgi:hypothetical protein